jgi:endonuclease III
VNDQAIAKILKILEKHLPDWDMPIVSALADDHADPFLLLISTLLSLRTKDEVTAKASDRLFRLADTPVKMLAIPEETIARTVFPVGFYRTKARTIHSVCRDLIDRFGGRVPDTMEDLLSLKGVGRKTANLVLSLGYGKDGICVDTHVHRISNRLGYVRTKTPGETEQALRAKLPVRWWIRYNTLMVAFGRTVCKPVSPLCSQCPVGPFCDRVGVSRSR